MAPDQKVPDSGDDIMDEVLQDGLSVELRLAQDVEHDMTMELQDSLQARDNGHSKKLQAKPKVLGKKRPGVEDLDGNSPVKAGTKKGGQKKNPLKRPAASKPSGEKSKTAKEVTKTKTKTSKPKNSTGAGGKKKPGPKKSQSKPKKTGSKKPKMTRECVYSRAYHKAKRSMVRDLFSYVCERSVAFTYVCVCILTI